LCRDRRGSDTTFYVSYGGILLALWIIALSCNAVFGQYVWIDFRDPDGSAVFLGENISAWYNTLGTTAGVAMNFAADAMLVSNLEFKYEFTGTQNRLALSLLHDLG
jgi:hypothetical protein